MSRLLVLVFILALTLNEGSALNCWVCSSDTDPDCVDPFDITTRIPTECAQREGFTSICQTMRLKVNSLEDVTARGCDFVPRGHPDNVTCMIPKLPGHSSVVKCFTCHSDGCNGGSFVPVTSTTFMVVTLTALAVIGRCVTNVM